MRKPTVRLSSALGLVAAVSLLVVCDGRDRVTAGQAPSGEAAPWLGPEAGVTREFELRAGEGTREALILFIVRHPDHPLADRARAMLRGVPLAGTPSPDAAVFADYSRALDSGTAAALRDFAARHPAHPLAAEARRQAGAQ
jgi:hypothetical protein